MALATVLCRAQAGIRAPLVTVEVHLAGGLPTMSIVGLPETAVRESKDRVRAALQNAGFTFPPSRITVSLAPADIPKEGGRYDLAVALGILVASGQMPGARAAGHVFAAELGLNGELRSIRGALSIALACAAEGQALVVPRANAPEAALAEDCRVLAADSLEDVCRYLRTGVGLDPVEAPPAREGQRGPDLADVRGQYQARRALEIAAAGGHNLLLFGPPGSGKTLLASRLPGLLPPMSRREAQESAALASLAGRFDPDGWMSRPFRAPHHTASAVALAGGGSHPRPGEISLAHCGVLFLDELPEFDRRVLEILREPLESGCIVIARATRRARFPARFQLVAAMNPCPCGYHGADVDRCHCSPDQVTRYQQRVSGPLVDRIDLHVEVPRMPPTELRKAAPGESSASVRERVYAARKLQIERQGCLNVDLSLGGLARHAPLGEAELGVLERACDRLGLSARAYHRVIKLSRTIADLDARREISLQDVTEAIQYRRLDRRASAAAF